MGKMNDRGHISDFEKKTMLALHQDYYPSKIARIFNVSEATVRNQLEDPRMPSERKKRTIKSQQTLAREQIEREIIMPMLKESDWKVKNTQIFKKVVEKYHNAHTDRTIQKWVRNLRKKHNRTSKGGIIKKKTASKQLVESVRFVINSLYEYFSVEMISKYTGIPEDEVRTVIAKQNLIGQKGNGPKSKRTKREPMSKGLKEPKDLDIRPDSLSKVQDELDAPISLQESVVKAQKQPENAKIKPIDLSKIRMDTIIPVMKQNNWQISAQEIYEIVLTKHPKMTNFQAIEREVELVQLAYKYVSARFSETQMTVID